LAGVWHPSCHGYNFYIASIFESIKTLKHSKVTVTIDGVMSMGTICTADDAICSSKTITIPAPVGVMPRAKHLFGRVISWIAEREEKRFSRLALAELTDEQLADIGVTPAEARREASQPFWN